MRCKFNLISFRKILAALRTTPSRRQRSEVSPSQQLLWLSRRFAFLKHPMTIAEAERYPAAQSCSCDASLAHFAWEVHRLDSNDGHRLLFAPQLLFFLLHWRALTAFTKLIRRFHTHEESAHSLFPTHNLSGIKLKYLYAFKIPFSYSVRLCCCVGFSFPLCVCLLMRKYSDLLFHSDWHSCCCYCCCCRYGNFKEIVCKYI